jgi:hypothetical protein
MHAGGGCVHILCSGDGYMTWTRPIHVFLLLSPAIYQFKLNQYWLFSAFLLMAKLITFADNFSHDEG